MTVQLLYALMVYEANPAILQGTVNLGIRKNLHWEAGAIFGLDSISPDTSFRFLLEVEF